MAISRENRPSAYTVMSINYASLPQVTSVFQYHPYIGTNAEICVLPIVQFDCIKDPLYLSILYCESFHGTETRIYCCRVFY